MNFFVNSRLLWRAIWVFVKSCPTHWCEGVRHTRGFYKREYFKKRVQDTSNPARVLFLKGIFAFSPLECCWCWLFLQYLKLVALDQQRWFFAQLVKNSVWWPFGRVAVVLFPLLTLGPLAHCCAVFLCYLVALTGPWPCLGPWEGQCSKLLKGKEKKTWFDPFAWWQLYCCTCRPLAPARTLGGALLQASCQIFTSSTSGSPWRWWAWQQWWRSCWQWWWWRLGRYLWWG